ncbi:EPIDERMAL PATTERNING FACTOR-like protein 4 [Platanthera zijinensis]|uniref:Epidermal patterning factor-like protein n=1 Tax=Platanthera zijinensis TaxID=2320716 RepID=A0AAP0B1L1_9ASPA
MGVWRRHWLGLSAALALFFIFFFFSAAARGSALVGITREKERANFMRTERLQNERWEQGAAVRRLAGPGSSPPTCRLRCGRCFPCRPVHVAIQPGRSVPLEYYPEAWRCECGNRLFMP